MKRLLPFIFLLLSTTVLSQVQTSTASRLRPSTTWNGDSSNNSTIVHLEAAPGAPTVALAGAGAGNVDNGAHYYKITFVTAAGQTQGGTASLVVTVADKTTNGQVSLSAIPLGSTFVTSRKIYRTLAGGSVYRLLATIADNTTTTYTDNTADSSIAAAAVSPTSNTTANPILTYTGSSGVATIKDLTVSGTCTGCGAASSPGGADTQVQFNDSGVFGGDAGLVYNKTTNVLTNLNTGIGATSADGIVLSNTTAATAGAQQWSPRIHLTGQGWKTDATAGSQAVDWIMENTPIQGASNPNTQLNFSSQINNGGYTRRFGITDELGTGGIYLGNNARLYNASNTLWLGSGALFGFDASNGFLLSTDSDTGLKRVSSGIAAVTNGATGSGSIAPQTNGGGDLGTSSLGWNELYLDKTITATGTVGAQTINKAAGSVNFAAAATSLVVTNNLVATTSVILCTIGTNDATMKSVACVAAAGSFTIHANAAATAETRVNFFVVN